VRKGFNKENKIGKKIFSIHVHGLGIIKNMHTSL
jgi:hypothetical protein